MQYKHFAAAAARIGRPTEGTMMRILSFAAALSLILCTSGSLSAADVDVGRTLTERWCSSCHVVSDSQSKATDQAPSFASIAERPDFNVDKLAFFLLDPHPKMPNMALSRAEAANISAYIATQKRP
jgi:mono/diheme cytochrome c family protein